MTIVALLIGFVLIAAAIRNTQAQLFGALGNDLPAYVVWAAALVAIGAIGFIPGLRTPSRYLLALVVVVLILNNYQAILSGFAAVSTPQRTAAAGGTAPAQSSASPPAAAAGAATPDSFGALIPPSSAASALGGQAGSTLMDAANAFGSFLGGGQ